MRRRMFNAFLLPLLLAARVHGQATAPATRLAVPDDAAQDRARTMIAGVFKNEFAKTAQADRVALARQLLDQARATNDDPAARYVLFVQALELAATAADPVTSFAAATELGRHFTVDPLEMKRQSIVRSALAVTAPEACQTLCNEALDTADEAALADNFDLVDQMTNIAEGAANKTRHVAFVASIQLRLADMRGLSADFPKVQAALTTLKASPDDGDAHLFIGRFYALRKGQWSIGLPHLAAGSDAQLRRLAQQDLDAPADGARQSQLGDAWWEYAEFTTGSVRRRIRDHACVWYAPAQHNLGGITLTRIQSRLAEAEGGAPAAATPELAATPTASVGNAINLLALVDPSKDATDGKWSLVNNALQCTAASRTCINFPYAFPDEYDLRITFARIEGQGPITVLLTSHGRTFGFALDIKGEARFERVANKIGKDNPTAAPIAISNGHPYGLTLQVHRDSIRALLDGKLITEWKTDYKDLARYAVWKLPNDKLPGLGASNARVVFSAVELVELNGKGSPTR